MSHFQAVHCVQKKCYITKGIQPIFKNFPFAERRGKYRYLAQKFHGRSYFDFAMVRWKLLQKENLKFTNSKLHTVQEKMLYHQRYSTDFQKRFLLLKDVENRYLSRKFHGRSYFSFPMVRWKLFPGGKIRNFPLSSCTLCQWKCYITKGINPIFTNFPSAERCRKWVFGPKISWAQLF